MTDNKDDDVTYNQKKKKMREKKQCKSFGIFLFVVFRELTIGKSRVSKKKMTEQQKKQTKR